MARRTSILKIIGRAFGACARNFHIALAAAALYGVSLAVVDHLVFSRYFSEQFRYVLESLVPNTVLFCIIF